MPLRFLCITSNSFPGQKLFLWLGLQLSGRAHAQNTWHPGLVASLHAWLWYLLLCTSSPQGQFRLSPAFTNKDLLELRHTTTYWYTLCNCIHFILVWTEINSVKDSTETVRPRGLIICSLQKSHAVLSCGSSCVCMVCTCMHICAGVLRKALSGPEEYSCIMFHLAYSGRSLVNPRGHQSDLSSQPACSRDLSTPQLLGRLVTASDAHPLYPLSHLLTPYSRSNSPRSCL